ncbi:MAG: class B sortase [Eubacteriales bacterium]|nr:class B sortase [Eubacteriales bacterium]
MRKGFSMVLMFVSAIVLAVSIHYLHQCGEEKQQMLGEVEKLKTAGQSGQPKIYKKVKHENTKREDSAKQKKSDMHQQYHPVSVNLEQIEKQNSRVIAWIEIPDTPISYPVVQGIDNEYYLMHTFLGEESLYGSIFLDCENSSSFADSHSVIYGHNMQDGVMFAFLNQYENPEVMQLHPYIYIYTSDRAFVYRIFSVYQAAIGDVSYEIGLPLGSPEYQRQLEQLVHLSEYDTGTSVDAKHPFLTLFTCNGQLADSERTAVHAILEEEFEKITKLS